MKLKLNGFPETTRTIELLELPPISEERFSEIVSKSPDLSLKLTREGTGLLIGSKNNDEPVKFALNRAVLRKSGWEEHFVPINQPDETISE